jgi:hypothetical protein
MIRVRRLDKNHDWTFGRGRANYAKESESIAQRVKTILLSFEGDWFLDLEHGIPWLQSFERPGDFARIEREVKRKILLVDGVERVNGFVMAFDRDTRRLTITTNITDEYGNETMVTNG